MRVAPVGTGRGKVAVVDGPEGEVERLTSHDGGEVEVSEAGRKVCASEPVQHQNRCGPEQAPVREPTYDDEAPDLVGRVDFGQRDELGDEEEERDEGEQPGPVERVPVPKEVGRDAGTEPAEAVEDGQKRDCRRLELGDRCRPARGRSPRDETDQERRRRGCDLAAAVQRVDDRPD